MLAEDFVLIVFVIISITTKTLERGDWLEHKFKIYKIKKNHAPPQKKKSTKTGE